METAAVARMCRQHDVPFGCVRVILDDLHTSLSPRLVALFSGGRISAWPTLAALFRSPILAAEFARLAGRARFASEQLGKALEELLTLTCLGAPIYNGSCNPYRGRMASPALSFLAQLVCRKDRHDQALRISAKSQVQQAMESRVAFLAAPCCNFKIWKDLAAEPFHDYRQGRPVFKS